eukprot:1177617-Prorocentrum_minimum.AAC.2
MPKSSKRPSARGSGRGSCSPIPRSKFSPKGVYYRSMSGAKVNMLESREILRDGRKSELMRRTRILKMCLQSVRGSVVIRGQAARCVFGCSRLHQRRLHQHDRIYASV